MHAEPPRWSRRGLLAGAAALPLACRAPRAGAGDAAARDLETRARHAELLAGLADQSASVAPLTEAERRPRRARLGAALAAAGVQAFLCEGGATMTWLSGVAWHRSERTFALLVFADGSHAWICPAFEAEKARLAIERPVALAAAPREPSLADGGGAAAPADALLGAGPGGEIRTWDEHEYAFAPLASLLRERRVERVAVDPQVRWFVARGLARELGAEALVDGAPLIGPLRMVKDARELEILRRANELTQAALARVAQLVHAGMRTGEIAQLVSRAQERLGLVAPWNLTLVGPAAAYPHGETAHQLLERDDLLLIDTGGTLHDYQSDITRTWVGEGRGRERELRAWHAVRAAQRAAFEAVRPGVECRAIDQVARASLARAGYGDGYAALTHRLGHGIGIEGHEDPYFDGGSTVVLQPGMTLSNEPGIYVLREFGVRIEDIVAVTADGADAFGTWQRSPEAP